MPVTGIGGVASRLAGPAIVGTALSTAYTALGPTIARDIKIANSSSATATFIVGVNGTTSALSVVPSASVAASTLATFALDIPLNAGDTVQIKSATDSAASFTLTGEVAGGVI